MSSEPRAQIVSENPQGSGADTEALSQQRAVLRIQLGPGSVSGRAGPPAPVLAIGEEHGIDDQADQNQADRQRGEAGGGARISRRGR